MADGPFAELQESHILLRLDSKNGKANFCDDLNVKRNASYVILMSQDQRVTATSATGKKYHPVKEVVRLTNPKKIDTIYGLVEFFRNQAEESKGK